MQMERAKKAPKSLVVSTLFGVLLASGCQSGQGDTGRGAGGTDEQSVTKMMGISGGGAGAVNQLDFFEALEQRSNVTWDEMLAGVLLAAGRRADGAYADRLNVARRAGILGLETPPGGDALATPSDLAKVLLRSQGIQLRDTISGDEAIALAARRSLMPATIGIHDTLTGEITVRALSAAGQPTATTRPGKPKPASATIKPPTGGSNP